MDVVTPPPENYIQPPRSPSLFSDNESVRGLSQTPRKKHKPQSKLGDEGDFSEFLDNLGLSPNKENNVSLENHHKSVHDTQGSTPRINDNERKRKQKDHRSNTDLDSDRQHSISDNNKHFSHFNNTDSDATVDGTPKKKKKKRKSEVHENVTLSENAASESTQELSPRKKKKNLNTDAVEAQAVDDANRRRELSNISGNATSIGNAGLDDTQRSTHKKKKKKHKRKSRDDSVSVDDSNNQGLSNGAENVVVAAEGSDASQEFTKVQEKSRTSLNTDLIKIEPQMEDFTDNEVETSRKSHKHKKKKKKKRKDSNRLSDAAQISVHDETGSDSMNENMADSDQEPVVVAKKTPRKKRELSGDQRNADKKIYSVSGAKSLVVKNRPDPETKTEKRTETDLTDPEIVADLLHTSNVVTLSTQSRKEEIARLVSQGVKVNSGKWTKTEKEQLQKNWKHFFEIHEVDDPYLFLKPMKIEDLQLRAKIIKQIKETQFFIELGKGIPRTTYQIYLCAKRVFQEDLSAGEWSDEETKKLIKLYAIYGNDWVKIGEKLGRSNQCVFDKWKLIEKPDSTGKWSMEEEKELIKAVKHFTGLDDLTGVHYNLPWQAVAKMVGSRSAKQCSNHWPTMLALHGGFKNNHIPFQSNTKMELLNVICNQDVYDESELDWSVISETLGGNYPPQYLAARWSKMKARIPNHYVLSFEDLTDKLVDLFQKKYA